MKVPFFNIEITRNRTSTSTSKKEKKSTSKKEGTGTKDTLPTLPATGGRQSVFEGSSSLASLFQEMATIQPDFEIRLLDVLEHLAKYNADLSYAVDNIVQLGNTSYEIFFDSSVSDEQRLGMIDCIEASKKSWYNHSGGLNSLINDLLAQCAITGAVSAEIVPLDDLSGVKKSVLVSPKNIRFLYNKDKDEFIPHQVVPYLNGEFVSKGGLKELNTVTYKYIAIRRFNEKPYAIPPFLSALENMSIERDMLDNLKHITKQLGVFGFLQVLVSAPSKRMQKSYDGKPPETDTQYEDRIKTYLSKQSKEVEKSLATGHIVGIKNNHEFDMKGNLANPEGARQLFDLNTEMKMSGLKQDPLMLGRNFSTTETIGRVILTKLSAQISNYQKLVANYLEELFLIELNLSGYSIDTLEVEFDKPMIGDEFKNQNSLGKKIENYDNLYKQGIISQPQRAQALGYEETDLEEPRQETQFTPIEADDGRKDPGKTDDKKDRKGKGEHTKEDIEAFSILLGSEVPEFDYQLDHDCSHRHTHSFNIDFGNQKVNNFFKKYATDTTTQYGKAIGKSTRQIGEELAKLTTGATVQQVTDAVIYNLYKNWKANFSVGQRKIIQKWVALAYKEFRNDKLPFGEIKNIPKQAVFNLTDMRTIEYFRNSDELYMGKFITDTDTRKKLTAFVKKNYIEGNLPLGDNKKVLDMFREQFGNLLKGEEHKLFRIISTTVNKMKNYASISYFKQAEVETFEVRGINDQLQCSYCSIMQGKRFSVTKWHDKVDEFVKGDPAYVKGASPFITSVFKGKDGIEKLGGLPSEEIEALGIGAPPFHPRCRDHIVAVL